LIGGQRRIDQIIELAAQGLTDKEIAQQLGISRHTVDTHWRRVKERLGAKNRAAAMLAHLRETVERQTQELQAANATLLQNQEERRAGMGTLLSDVQRQLAQYKVLSQQQAFHLTYFERASHMARLAVYELESINPVKHRYVSAGVTAFNHDPAAMQSAASTLYDVLYVEDMHRLYEVALNLSYPPDARYVFLYRLLMPEPRWVLDTHQAVYGPEGVPVGYMGIVQDVDDLVRAGLLPAEVTCVTLPASPIPYDPELR
jgi:transposase